MAKNSKNGRNKPVSKPKLSKDQQEANDRSEACKKAFESALKKYNCGVKVYPVPVLPGTPPQYNIEIVALS